MSWPWPRNEQHRRIVERARARLRVQTGDKRGHRKWVTCMVTGTGARQVEHMYQGIGQADDQGTCQVVQDRHTRLWVDAFTHAHDRHESTPLPRICTGDAVPTNDMGRVGTACLALELPTCYAIHTLNTHTAHPNTFQKHYKPHSFLSRA